MGQPGPSDDHLSALMRAAQQGDAAAYRELLRLVTPRIRRVVSGRRVFSRTERVEDVVQDVLLSVHVVRATYDPNRPFMPWLLAIVRNRMADAARRYARTAAREVLIEDPDVTFAAGATNRDQEASDALRVLDDAVQALPAGQRQAIQLLKLDGLSLKEAAAKSGMSIGALKVATHRAITALRKALAGSATRT